MKYIIVGLMSAHPVYIAKSKNLAGIRYNTPNRSEAEEFDSEEKAIFAMQLRKEQTPRWMVNRSLHVEAVE